MVENGGKRLNGSFSRLSSNSISYLFSYLLYGIGIILIYFSIFSAAPIGMPYWHG